MPSLKFQGYALAVLALVVGTLVWVSPALASDEAEALAQAVQLFNDGEYVRAQEILAGIDRSELSPEDQARRDEYIERAKVAVSMAEKAMRDLEDAETALADGDAEGAKMLLEAVLANEYAHRGVRSVAEGKLRALTEQPTEEAPAEVSIGSDVDPADAERARTLTAEGDEMLRASRFDEAERLYDAALELVPGYPEAVEGLHRLQDHRENITGTRGGSLAERLRALDAINWQRTESEYRTIERAIRGHVAAERFQEASQALHRARQIVEAGKQFADPITKYESLRSEYASLNDWVSEEERVYNVRTIAEVRRQIEEQRKTRLREIEDNKRREIRSLMKQARQHRKDGNLEAGIRVLSQVTMIDPSYKEAQWQMDDWQDMLTYRRQRELNEQMSRQSQRVFMDVEEAKIPWHEQLRYPKNWVELISRPERNKPGYSARDSLLYGALDRPVQVDFQKVPFGQAIERLADAHDLNISVNWADLETASVNVDRPITLSMPNEITLKKVLTEVLAQAGGTVPLGYGISDGVLTIATQDTVDRDVYPVVHDISDLLMEIPNFTDAPHTDMAEQLREQREAWRSADRPWRFGDDDDDEPEEDSGREARVRKLINLIQDTIAPDSWYENGSILEFNGQLVITQNSVVQGQVDGLLSKLREQRAVQISVEARFLTVASHYLEELGLDIDVVLNSGSAGYDYVPTGSPDAPYASDPVLGSRLLMPRQFSRVGFTPATPTVGNQIGGGNNQFQFQQPYQNPAFVPARTGGSGSYGSPIPVGNGTTEFTNPASFAHDISGTFAGQTIGPALNVMGSFLDNIQVDFLLRATQADSRTSTLTAPRLVLFNGQRSWVAVTVQTNFVSQLIPQVNVAAAAQLPQTGVINAGAVLDVQAAVSDDRRYVTMTLRPGVTRLNQLSTFQTSGGGTAGDAFLQLPELSTQLIKTTVSVPDGGTLLIGGQKLAAESETEAGVPILSKIPILKRAYSSRVLIKDEQTLLMLIKPKVFIQSEQEELAFPSFSSGN